MTADERVQQPPKLDWAKAEAAFEKMLANPGVIAWLKEMAKR